MFSAPGLKPLTGSNGTNARFPHSENIRNIYVGFTIWEKKKECFQKSKLDFEFFFYGFLPEKLTLYFNCNGVKLSLLDIFAKNKSNA